MKNGIELIFVIKKGGMEMSNMSYCRFENTVKDLQDCADHICDDLSEDEEKARQRLVRLCRNIIEEVDPEYGE